MNLSGNNIKKYILRRYSIDELESIFNQKLNNQSRNFKHYAHMSSNKFMVIVVSLITEEILVQLTDGWVEDSPIPEEGLYEFIQEIFGERIIKKYDELTNMNLQESIRRILREELSPRIRRRVPADEMEREFLESFEMAYNITKNRKVLSKQFLDELIYTTASVMMSGIHWRLFTTLPEDEFWYDEIHNELENHYRERIIKMYKKREGINESILKEESKRDEMIDLYLAKRISSFTKFDMKDGLHPRIEFVDDKSHHSMVVIHFNRRAQKNEVNMDDSLYGEIYNMFSMDGFEEIQKHLKRWFSNNFDGLNDISEIYTFENDEYIY